MKKVYLIRHAKSSWSNPDSVDFERELNDRGVKDAKVVSDALHERVDSIDIILTSTARRAIQTKEILFKKSDRKTFYKEVVKDDDLYHASSKKILRAISNLSNQHSSVAIIGHNPGLTELANSFSNVTIDNLPTTGVLAVEFEIEKWEKVLKKTGNLLFFEYPKRLKSK